jgi:hypothetical protein
MAKPKGATSYRLSDDAQHLIMALADRLGVSKTGVLEMAVRKLARAELGEGVGAWAAQPHPPGPGVTVASQAVPN